MPFDPNTFREDIKLVKEYGSNVQNDSELMSRLNSYVDSGLVTNEDVNGIIKNDSVPSHVWGVVDSLKNSNSPKPVVAPVEKPVEKTAMETILGAVFPRTVDRYNEGKTGLVGDVVAGGLDAASLIPRISSNIQQAPIALSNMVQSNKPPQQALKEYFSNIGDTQGKSFQTLNAPEWLPDIVQTVANKIQPINQGIGEFITSVHRGPIIPGGVVGKFVTTPASWIVGKPAMTAASEALPSALKTALGVIENVGTGAALGTSESVARGEGVDGGGVAIGTGFGLLPYIGRGIQTKANSNSNITSIDNLIKTYQDDLLHGDDAAKEAALETLESIKKLGKEKYAEILKRSMVQGADIELSQEGNEAIQDFYMKTVNKNKPKIYIKPTAEPTLKQTVDKLTKWNDITVPGPLSKYGKEPIIRDVGRSRQSNNPLSQEEMILLGNTGRLANAKSGLLNILLGHSPADLITPLSRNLPDATATRNYGTSSGNLLVNPLLDYFSQQDSTKR